MNNSGLYYTRYCAACKQYTGFRGDSKCQLCGGKFSLAAAEAPNAEKGA